MVTVRPETPADYASVRRVHEYAFEQAAEADLVEALRRTVRSYLSLVAEVDGRVVGHIFFSPVTVESGPAAFTALGLAPMAVLPEHQRRGVGTALVRQGLAACAASGHPLVVVLGHPSYYPRFGFEPAAPRGLRSEYDVPDEVFMVAELEPGALAGRGGLVKYHAAFGALE